MEDIKCSKEVEYVTVEGKFYGMLYLSSKYILFHSLGMKVPPEEKYKFSNQVKFV